LPNECATLSCSDVCAKNENDVFVCKCRIGYKLNVDQKTCSSKQIKVIKRSYLNNSFMLKNILKTKTNVW